LLYQVATAGLSPGEIAAPIRSILRRHKNVEVLMAEVTGFDLERRVVKRRMRKFPTILSSSPPAPATPISATTSGNLAPGLKTIEDAIEIRRRVLLAFELAERRACRWRT
jgi:NADH:ubiquinone reductase (H+-translocating)